MDSFVEENTKPYQPPTPRHRDAPLVLEPRIANERHTKKQKEQQFEGEDVGVYLKSGTLKTSQNDDF